MHHQPLIVRWSMPIAIIALFALSLAPTRMMGWTGWFNAQALVVFMPLTNPAGSALDMIIPPTVSDPGASQRENELKGELARYRTQLLQTKAQNARLNQLIEQFSRGAAITPNLDVRQVHRPRISSLVGDLLVIRTGPIEGLTQGTVVVVDAVQLLGKVTRVNNKTATVRPITAASAQPILATVLLNESGSKQASCLLTPVGDGTLIGEVARSATDHDASDSSWGDLIGKEVRLLDNQWPQHAQMLVIGTIERIKRNDAQPLRQRIIVRPTIADLRRVPEVILRLPAIESNKRDGATP